MRRMKNDSAAARKSGRRLSAWFHGGGARCAMVIAAGSLVLYLLFCIACAPQRYSLEVGEVSNQTITATKDVEDIITTEQRRKAASNAVEVTYHLQEGATEAVLQSVDDLFLQLRTVQEYGKHLRGTAAEQASGEPFVFTEDQIRHAQSQVTLITLTEEQTRALLATETDSFSLMVSEVRSAVASALNTTIREGQVTNSINNIKQMCNYKIDASLRSSVVPAVLNACVKPNMVVDQEATQRARNEAAAQVEPVIYLQGQNIIREGEQVTANQLAMLEALGLLDSAKYDLAVYVGAAVLVLVAMLLMVLMLRMLSPEVLTDLRSMMVIMLVLIITEGLSVITVKLISVYLSPVTLGAMLLCGLLSPRVGLTAGFTLTLTVAGLAAASNTTYTAEMVHMLLLGMAGSVAATQFLMSKPQRVRVVVCGVLVAAVNVAVMLSVGLMTSADIRYVMMNAVWAMAGGLLSGLIAVGFQPVFEAVFNLATPSKLLELANPNQPLLRRLLLEAPGTYHHSIVVANLSEAAAEKIGANPLLARTGAYFHDIGKLKRPLYFKENQRGENPHDRTDAYVSAAIVTSHTRDGLHLAQKHHLPPEIQKIIAEHHGDTPVMYFYHKALQQADGKPVDISDFRYGGSRPATKESAIVMLADTIEAAVRSMSDPTPQAIKRFIERLVRGKLEDGQLSESPLTLKDIDGVCEAFTNVLSGVFHERIEYPTVQLPVRGEAPAAAQPAAHPAEPAEKPETAAPAPVEAEMPEPYNAPMPDGEPVQKEEEKPLETSVDGEDNA